MYEDQRRLQKLLCPQDVEAVKGDGATKLQKWLRLDDARSHGRIANQVEETTKNLREFDVRPIPQRCPSRIHTASFRDDADS